MSYSYTVFEREVFALRTRGVCLFVSLVLLPCLLSAKEYGIKQIADKTLLNREPVISETGLIAWYAYERSKDTSSADVFIYKDGIAQKLTKNKGDSGLHPYVYRDTVVWAGSLSKEMEYTETVYAMPEPEESPASELTETNGNEAVDSPSEPKASMAPVASSVTKTMMKQGWGICRWADGQAKPVSFSLDSDSSGFSAARTPTNQLLDSLENLNTDLAGDAAEGVLNVTSPVCWGDYTAWQRASPWPCGWEIALARVGDAPKQLTTNCYYDMGPQMHDRHLVWYAWDGQDYEIMMHDLETGETIQLTDNNFDDVSPVVWNGVVAWEGYPSVEGDIFLWREGKITMISENIEDDVNPRIWDKYVVWQGIQDDNYEIFLYDGASTRRITKNNYDDVDPNIRDELICWVGYVDNWDAEILIQEVNESAPTILTDNDYEDHHPRTANGVVVWEAKREGLPLIYVAEPR